MLSPLIHGNIEGVKQAIAAGADVNAENEFGSTPLAYAAVNGRKEIAELLIANGANVNGRSSTLGFPLHLAIDECHKGIVELLIANGANVNERGHMMGKTPLDCAESASKWDSPKIIAAKPEIADLLRKHGGKTYDELKAESPTTKASGTSICDAVEEGNIEAVKQHLSTGTDVNAKDAGGFTPLHWAVFGHKELFALLIDAGADVNAQDNWGATPLDQAEGETADLLRKYGGKTKKELKDQGKPTDPVPEVAKPEPPTAKAPDISIHDAAYEGNFGAVKQHLANGADVTAKDEDGWSVLDMALASKNEEIIKLIKTSGGHSNADKSIFVASGIGNLEAVQQHFASGVDVNAKSEVNGWTPLHYADQIKVAEFLLKNDSRVNAVDIEGKTPLDNAIFWRDSAIAELLRKHGGKTGEELKAEGK